jgi:hypothetical protein
MPGWRRSRLLKPARRFRRWVRHTPNSEVVRTLTMVGLSVVFIAGALVFYVL